MPKNTKRKITEEQKQILLQNTNVEEVTEFVIRYTKEFKQKALKLSEQGLSAKQIFIDAGFDLSIIGKDSVQSSLGNWKHHQKKNTKNATKYLAKQTKKKAALKAVIEENKYLRAENDFLKKLQALEEILG